MRAWLLSVALPLILTASAFAQQQTPSPQAQQPTLGPPAQQQMPGPQAQQQTPGPQAQQQAPGPQAQQQNAVQPGLAQARARPNLQAAGSDGRMMQGFILVRATDRYGNPVLVLVNPDTGEAIPIGRGNLPQQPRQAQQAQQQLQQAQQQQQPQQQLQPPQQAQLQQPPPQQQAQLQQQQLHVPLKTIGHPQTEVVPTLIVFNAHGASLQGGKLVLIGVSPSTIVFADRPVRAAGQDLTAHIIDDWSNGADNFASDPPNATVSGYSTDSAGVRDAVVVLKTPRLDGDQLTFDVEVLEGDLTGVDGPAALFIDTIGRPWASISDAGAEHHVARRGTWYAGDVNAPGTDVAP